MGLLAFVVFGVSLVKLADLEKKGASVNYAALYCVIYGGVGFYLLYKLHKMGEVFFLDLGFW